MKLLPENIDHLLFRTRNANCATVIFSPPRQNDFSVLLQDLSQPVKASPSFIFHPFNTATSPRIVIHPTHYNQDALDHVSEMSDGDIWSLGQLENLESTSYTQYAKAFSDYGNAIRSGICSKAVLSTVVKKNIPIGFRFGEFLIQLRHEYPGACIYLFTSPFAGTWIGATPETLLEWDSGQVTSMSLAGTRNQSIVPEFGSKEINEQEFVTDYIEQVFTSTLGNCTISQPEELQYGNLAHLITRVSAIAPLDFNRESFLHLAGQLHPTPAVGGTPKIPATELINQVEEHSRFYYSGYLGQVSDSSAKLFVNLRCMSVTKDTMYVFAGGGITIDSLLENEWQETRFKAGSLLKFV